MKDINCSTVSSAKEAIIEASLFFRKNTAASAAYARTHNKARTENLAKTLLSRNNARSENTPPTISARVAVFFFSSTMKLSFSFSEWQEKHTPKPTQKQLTGCIVSTNFLYLTDLCKLKKRSARKACRKDRTFSGNPFFRSFRYRKRSGAHAPLRSLSKKPRRVWRRKPTNKIKSFSVGACT